VSYHDLSECTLSPDERRAEGLKIAQILDSASEKHEIAMNIKEFDFVAMILSGPPVSIKQLFWLRDIKERYLD